MAVDMFLKLDGIDGESQDKTHTGWIEISSFSWGASNTTIGSATGGAGAGKASFQDLHFEQLFDKSSPQVALYCATGKHIATATLSVRKAGGSTDAAGNSGSDFLKIKMTDVLVSSFQVAGADGEDDRPTEGASLNFIKIDFDYVAPTGEESDIAIDLTQ